jgi:hypothetical protein
LPGSAQPITVTVTVLEFHARAAAAVSSELPLSTTTMREVRGWSASTATSWARVAGSLRDSL